MDFHAKTNSTPKPDALPRQNSQRQFPYVREHSTPKLRRRQHLLDGVIFTAPRLNSVLGGRTNFHAETSLHAETAKKDLLPTIPTQTCTQPRHPARNQPSVGPRARACPRRNPRPCFGRERQSPANTAPIPLCAAPSKWERCAIHHSSNTWPQHAAIVHLSMLPLFRFEMNSGRAVAQYLIEDRRFHMQIRRFNFLLL